MDDSFKRLLEPLPYIRNFPNKLAQIGFLSAAGGRDSISSRFTPVPEYKSLVRRYYSELWNAWSTPTLNELISPDVIFRGSIGTAVHGIEEFKQYVNKIRAVFPDFHNQIDEIFGEDDKVVARLTYTGTHRGELFGISGTGRKISCQGIAIFQLREGKIVSGFVLGDTESLKRQISAT